MDDLFFAMAGKLLTNDYTSITHNLIIITKFTYKVSSLLILLPLSTATLCRIGVFLTTFSVTLINLIKIVFLERINCVFIVRVGMQ